MRFWKIAVAILFSLLMLIFTRSTTSVRSVHKMVDGEGIVIDHHTVPKQVGDEIPVISARVEGASEVRLVYKIGPDGEYRTVAMSPQPAEADVYQAAIPLHPKGIKAWYYLEAVASRELGEVMVTLPGKNQGEIEPIKLKFEGEVPSYIIISHVLCIFGAIFCSVLALFSVVDMRKGKITLRQSLKFPIWTLALLFLGFVPFGIAMNYFAFGVIWEAFPFGRDVTDNKSQIMMLFWLITLILVKGTLFGKGESKNFISKRSYSSLVIISFIANMIILAIPHSL
jgi:hypothetical protein